MNCAVETLLLLLSPCRTPVSTFETSSASEISSCVSFMTTERGTRLTTPQASATVPHCVKPFANVVLLGAITCVRSCMLISMTRSLYRLRKSSVSSSGYHFSLDTGSSNEHLYVVFFFFVAISMIIPSTYVPRKPSLSSNVVGKSCVGNQRDTTSPTLRSSWTYGVSVGAQSQPCATFSSWKLFTALCA